MTVNEASVESEGDLRLAKLVGVVCTNEHFVRVV